MGPLPALRVVYLELSAAEGRLTLRLANPTAEAVEAEVVVLAAPQGPEVRAPGRWVQDRVALGPWETAQASWPLDSGAGPSGGPVLFSAGPGAADQRVAVLVNLPGQAPEVPPRPPAPDAPWAPAGGPLPKTHFRVGNRAQPEPLDLDSLGYNPEQEPAERPRGFGAYHWIQGTYGFGRVTVGHRELSLGPGQGILLPPHQPHSYVAQTWPWSTRYLTFGGPLAEALVTSWGLPCAVGLTWPSSGPLETFLAQVIADLGAGRGGSPGTRSAAVYRFLTLVQDQAAHLEASPWAGDEVEARLAPLVVWVDEHLANPALGVEDLAAFLLVSPRQLHDLFTRAGRPSPYQYLKGRRISRARDLILTHRDRGIKEIAYQVGFRDPSHFVHAFRQAVGKTPDQFRRSQSP